MESTAAELPFEQCYWVIPGRFMAGCYPGSVDPGEMSRKLKRLVDAGITLVVNLMEADETDHSGRAFHPYQGEWKQLARAAGYEVEILRFPVRDLGAPSRQAMRNILYTINESLTAGGRVYVHCRGGRGRTGTVVGCYLMADESASRDDVLMEIQRLRAQGRDTSGQSPESERQINMVLSWTGEE